MPGTILCVYNPSQAFSALPKPTPKGNNVLPDHYREAFEAVLLTQGYNTKTIKTFRSRFRAISRAMDAEDLKNSNTVLQYRCQLAQGTLNLVDVSLRMLADSVVAAEIAPVFRRPVVVYPHPLFADVMLLGAVFGNERLPLMTWDLFEKDFRVTEAEVQAARRCLRWFGGDDRLKPGPLTPVVPKDNQLNPMQLWQIEYIINSPTMNANLKKGYAKETIAELIELIVTHAVRLNAKASVLRFACDRAHQINRLTAEIDMRVLRHDLALLKTQEQLVELASTLPQDPEVDTPAMW